MRDYNAYHRQGTLAFREGLARDANPFPAGTYAHEAFNEGWSLACSFSGSDVPETPLKLKNRPDAS